jgi:hypothetical protein
VFILFLFLLRVIEVTGDTETNQSLSLIAKANIIITTVSAAIFLKITIIIVLHFDLRIIIKFNTAMRNIFLSGKYLARKMGCFDKIMAKTYFFAWFNRLTSD